MKSKYENPNRDIWISLALIVLLFLLSPVLHAKKEPPRIVSVNTPTSANSGQTFELSVTASSIFGVKLVKVRFEGKTQKFRGRGLKFFTFTAQLKAGTAGKRRIIIVPVDINNVSGKSVIKTINIIGMITPIPTYTVITTKTVKKPKGFKLDPKVVGAEPLEPAKLFSFTISIDPKPVIVGMPSKVVVNTDMPAPSEGLKFVAKITTLTGSSAYSFEQRQFDIQITPGSRSASFSIKASKPYPDGVYINVSRDERIVEEKVKVLMPAEIKSLIMENEPVADVLTVDADSNKKCIVELDKASTSGGTEIKLKVDGPDSGNVILEPSELTIEEGKTTGSFQTQIGVFAEEYFTLTASTFSKKKLITVNVNPFVQVSSLSVTPHNLHRGQSGKGTIKLTNPALKGGVSIKLYKTDYGAQFVTMPDLLTIPNGKDKGEFAIQVSVEAKPKSKFTIFAYLSSKSKIKQQYIINPFRITSFSIAPDIMVNRSSNLKMILDGPAPSGGLACLLKIRTPLPDDNWAYGFEKHMHRFSFPQSSKNITIPIKTDREYPSGVDFIVTCSSDDIYLKKRISVIAEQLIKSLTVSPQPIMKGRIGLGTIVLNRADLAGNSTIVTLTNLSESTKAYVEIDDELIIPINQTTGSFKIQIDPAFPGSKFFLKAQIPSGSSKTIEVKIGG